MYTNGYIAINLSIFHFEISIKGILVESNFLVERNCKY